MTENVMLNTGRKKRRGMERHGDAGTLDGRVEARYRRSARDSKQYKFLLNLAHRFSVQDTNIVQQLYVIID